MNRVHNTDKMENGVGTVIQISTALPLPSEDRHQIIIDILATAIVDILLVEKSVDRSAPGPSTS